MSDNTQQTPPKRNDHCSFCGRPRTAFKGMVENPNGSVAICNDCINICKEILNAEERKRKKEEELPLPKPKQIKEQLGLDDKAVGVIFLSKNNEMKPFVWVKDVDTFYEETACGSGSISSALAIQKSQNKKYYIKQPSGVVFEIKLSKNTIVISGEWKQ